MRTILDESVIVNREGWVLSARLLSPSDRDLEPNDIAVSVIITTPDDEDTETMFTADELRPLAALILKGGRV
jgi:hypothetical protein